MVDIKDGGNMNDLFKATLETLEMSVLALLFSYIIGLPIGILTNETSKNGVCPCKPLNFICEILIGAGRAIPFTILMILVLPLTRFLVGTGVGTTATIVPLTIAAIPFVARTVANSLNLVDLDIVEASQIDGASRLKIIFFIKLGSRLFDIISSMGLTSVAIISYTAISGMLGGGGLGNFAVVRGYYRYDWMSVLYATLIIIGIVCLFQWGFTFLSKLVDWRKRK